MTTCDRCGGAGGAHYAGCVLQNLLQRWLGPDYPLWPPPTPADGADWEAREAASDLARQVAEMRRELDAALEAITRPDAAAADLAAAQADLAAAKADLLVDFDVPESMLRAPGSDTKSEASPNGKQRNNQHLLDNAAKARAALKIQQDAARELREKALDEYLADCAAVAPGQLVPIVDLLKDYRAWAEISRDTRPVPHETTFRSMLQTRPGFRPGTWPTGPKAAYQLDGPKGEPPIDQQMAKRRQAEAEAKARLPKPRKRTAKYRYDGPRPGQEITSEYRQLLEPLWETPGWSYAPRNPNGGGKPRVTNPAGTSYVIPNTPGDRRAILNTRSALRRLGAPL